MPQFGQEDMQAVIAHIERILRGEPEPEPEFDLSCIDPRILNGEADIKGEVDVKTEAAPLDVIQELRPIKQEARDEYETLIKKEDVVKKEDLVKEEPHSEDEARIRYRVSVKEEPPIKYEFSVKEEAHIEEYYGIKEEHHAEEEQEGLSGSAEQITFIRLPNGILFLEDSGIADYVSADLLAICTVHHLPDNTNRHFPIIYIKEVFYFKFRCYAVITTTMPNCREFRMPHLMSKIHFVDLAVVYFLAGWGIDDVAPIKGGSIIDIDEHYDFLPYVTLSRWPACNDEGAFSVVIYIPLAHEDNKEAYLVPIDELWEINTRFLLYRAGWFVPEYGPMGFYLDFVNGAGDPAIVFKEPIVEELEN